MAPVAYMSKVAHQCPKSRRHKVRLHACRHQVLPNSNIDQTTLQLHPVGPVEQLRQLARQGEQLQRYADELDVVFDEAERKRQEAVAQVERQYVDVVARLGREHEQVRGWGAGARLGIGG